MKLYLESDAYRRSLTDIINHMNARVVNTVVAWCSGLGALISFLQVFASPSRQKQIVWGFLATTLFSVAAWLTASRLRKVRVICGYRETMSYLEKIVRESERSIWTLRTHVGDASAEEPFFTVVAERLADMKRPIEDFRRNI